MHTYLMTFLIEVTAALKKTRQQTQAAETGAKVHNLSCQHLCYMFTEAQWVNTK
jgi:hypothetical protein